jgi:hypothetical protein
MLQFAKYAANSSSTVAGSAPSIEPNYRAAREALSRDQASAAARSGR